MSYLSRIAVAAICTVISTRMVEATASTSTKSPYISIIVRPRQQLEVDFNSTEKLKIMVSLQSFHLVLGKTALGSGYTSLRKVLIKMLEKCIFL